MENNGSKIEIVPFSKAEKEAIKTLNYEWLEKYFKVEPKDEHVLNNPQQEIIDKGGIIYYTNRNGKLIGTATLLKHDDSTFELSKMAITENAQGLGIGRQLIDFCLNEAKKMGIQRIFLYSNRKLNPAIYLYESFGFKEIPVEDGVYERADIKMELILS